MINMHSGASEAPHFVVFAEPVQANRAFGVVQLGGQLVLSHVVLERLPVLTSQFVFRIKALGLIMYPLVFLISWFP
jgi:hypothetical protein